LKRHAEGFRRLVQAFLAGKETFWGFHEAFLDQWTRLPKDALAPDEREAWNEIYGLILTAIPDPVSGEDGARGVIGEAELRERLRRHPLSA
jgi:hypothetical protein